MTPSQGPSPYPAQAHLQMYGVGRNIWVGSHSVIRTLSGLCYSERGVTFRTLGLFASRSEGVRSQLLWIPGRRIPVYLPLHMAQGSALVYRIQNKTYKQRELWEHPQIATDEIQKEKVQQR